jgi:hypothetical protein
MTEHEIKPSLTDQVLNHFLSNLVGKYGFTDLTESDLIEIKSLSDLTNQTLLDVLMTNDLEAGDESK